MEAPAGIPKRMEEAKTSMEEIVANLSAVKGEHYAIAVRDIFSLLNGVECLLTMYAILAGEMNESQKDHFDFFQSKMIGICYEQLMYISASIALTESIIVLKDSVYAEKITALLPAMSAKKTEEIKNDVDMLVNKLSEFKGMFII